MRQDIWTSDWTFSRILIGKTRVNVTVVDVVVTGNEEELKTDEFYIKRAIKQLTDKCDKATVEKYKVVKVVLKKKIGYSNV